MGLSAFARARVSLLPESELEVERFVEWNAAHQKGFRDMDDLHTSLEGKVEAIREASAAAVQVIGEKVVAGLQENVEDTDDSIDQQMREDHVRDMVGRRHVVDPQGEPMSIMDRLHGRVPNDVPHSVPLIAKTDVEGPGPTKEEMEAAYEEQEPWVLPSEEVVEEKTPPTRNTSNDGGSPGHGETARSPAPAAKKPILKPASKSKDD